MILVTLDSYHESTDDHLKRTGLRLIMSEVLDAKAPLTGLQSIANDILTANHNPPSPVKTIHEISISSVNSPRSETSHSEILLYDTKKADAQNETVRNLLNEKSAERTDPVSGFKKMMPVTNVNRPNLMSNHFDSDTESSSFFEEDEIQLSGLGSKNKVNQKSGTIGTAIGSIVGVSNSSSSANNSIASVNTNQKGHILSPRNQNHVI